MRACERAACMYRRATITVPPMPPVPAPEPLPNHAQARPNHARTCPNHARLCPNTHPEHPHDGQVCDGDFDAATATDEIINGLRAQLQELQDAVEHEGDEEQEGVEKKHVNDNVRCSTLTVRSHYHHITLALLPSQCPHSALTVNVLSSRRGRRLNECSPQQARQRCDGACDPSRTIHSRRPVRKEACSASSGDFMAGREEAAAMRQCPCIQVGRCGRR